MIKFDYIRREIIEGGVSPEDYPFGIPLYDTLILGDLTFIVEGVDFSMKNVYIPSFACGLYFSINELLKGKVTVDLCIIDVSLDFVLTTLSDGQMSISYNSVYSTSSTCLLEDMRKGAEVFLKRVLFDIFTLYPNLLTHARFLDSVPLGHETAKQFLKVNNK